MRFLFIFSLASLRFSFANCEDLEPISVDEVSVRYDLAGRTGEPTGTLILVTGVWKEVDAQNDVNENYRFVIDAVNGKEIAPISFKESEMRLPRRWSVERLKERQTFAAYEGGIFLPTNEDQDGSNSGESVNRSMVTLSFRRSISILGDPAKLFIRDVEQPLGAQERILLDLASLEARGILGKLGYRLGTVVAIRGRWHDRDTDKDENDDSLWKNECNRFFFDITEIEGKMIADLRISYCDIFRFMNDRLAEYPEPKHHEVYEGSVFEIGEFNSFQERRYQRPMRAADLRSPGFHGQLILTNRP